MGKTDIKKCLSFIKANAKEVPATERDTKEWVIPKEIVDEIENQINENDGSFALDLGDFNRQFGWKPTHSKSVYLKNKLNKQYPRDDGTIWHVGTIAKGTLYSFEIKEVKTEVEPSTNED